MYPIDLITFCWYSFAIQKAVNETKSQMDFAQSELDIYVSNEKKEKSVLDTMNEQLETAKSKYSDRCSHLEELEADLPRWNRTLAEKQKELQQVTIITESVVRNCEFIQRLAPLDHQ